MTGFRKGLCAALLALALGSGPAPAAEAGCVAQPVTALPLILLNGKVLVGALVNGQPAFMAIDTGGFASSVSETLAARLKLQTFPIRNYQNLRDIGDERANKYARIDSLQLGNLKGGEERLMVGDLGPGIDGFIAPDYLRNFDLDFDFAGSMLTLYRPGACAGHPPGEGEVNAVDMDVTEQGHIRIPVILDGKRLWATVDTGSGNSYITESEAGDFGIKPGGRRVTARGANSGVMEFEPHQFDALQLGTLTQRMPTLGVAAVDHGFDTAPVLLGMAQLRGLRLYLSYRERKLYVSRPATAARAAPPPASVRSASAAAPPAPAPDGALGPADAVARAASGATETATYSFVVQSVGRADGSLFLDSDTNYRDSGNLAVDVPEALIEVLRTRFGSAPGNYLRGKRIVVEGVPKRVLIRTQTAAGAEGSYYQTHIRLDDASQLRVVN